MALGDGAPAHCAQLPDRHHASERTPPLPAGLGVWVEGLGSYFSTGCSPGTTWLRIPRSRSTLDGSDAVAIVEGSARRVVNVDELEHFVDAYNPKYAWDIRVQHEGVMDSEGNSGPVHVVAPRIVFGWIDDLKDPTRWSFEEWIRSLHERIKLASI